MANAVLVGCGNLGSRHLQALASVEELDQIFVIDPFESSLDLGRKRLREIGDSIRVTDISFAGNARDLVGCIDKIDLAIIATNSNVRCEALVKLAELVAIDYVLFEKFLFPEPNEYQRVQTVLDDKKIKAWVNCSRRMYPIYQQLKSRQLIQAPAKFIFSGSEWGLTSNSIHFVDIVNYLTNEDLVKADLSRLDSKVYDAKRAGFCEFYGTMGLMFAAGSQLYLTHNQKTADPSEFSFIIDTADYKITINETQGCASIASKIDQKESQLTFSIPYQSSLTSALTRDLLEKGACDLTPYATSKNLHISLLKIFTDHAGAILGQAMTGLSIT